MPFDLVAPYAPCGDQPQAIAKLVDGFRRRTNAQQVLLGVTGSGKTFTMANVIAALDLPTLVISHNKTLAAQLYGEFRQYFPRSAVEYFVSYYDYYQPEAYVPASDTYIEKDATINEEIDRLRLKATSALVERRDVVIVASVSCIYGIGAPANFEKMLVVVEGGQRLDRDELLRSLVEIQYTRNEMEQKRGTFRARGEVVEVRPAHEEVAVRIELDDDVVERITQVDLLTGETLAALDRAAIYPATHYVTPREDVERACGAIEAELGPRLDELERGGKLLEAERLRTRTRFDLEMLRELGYCSGIENYARHLAGYAEGAPPYTLHDYFPDDFLVIIDESHVTMPQLRGMFVGDRSRKQTLVEHGFRLPSALDNRPLRLEEWEKRVGPVLFVSATPADYELARAGGEYVEQIIRPTGLMDPVIEVKPTKGQIDDLLAEIRKVEERGERVLVTTLTKRMAEDLTEYLLGFDVRVRYLHSDIDAIERIEILRGLRMGDFDVLVGINLLREGLDLPEVSLVAILDADREGFLRSETSLIQTAGRAARNLSGRVIMYADQVTGSMRRAMEETERRRAIQGEYNQRMGITPRSVTKSIEEIQMATSVADVYAREEKDAGKEVLRDVSGMEPQEALGALEKEMREAARRLDFETAASLRDQIDEVRAMLALGPISPARKGGEKSRTAGRPAGGPTGGGRGRRAARARR